MTSRVTTKDTLTVHQNGRVVDERSSESHLDTRLQGQCADTLHPLAASSMFCSPTSSNFAYSSTPSSLSSSPSPRAPSRNSSKSPSPLSGITTPISSSPLAARATWSSPSRGKKHSSSVGADLVEALSRTDLSGQPNPKNGEYVKLHQVHKVQDPPTKTLSM
ncbi:putative protein TPRXL [Penaeus japonicus]|uniref:putative protein TPRXL n=1 Tax=Penaeus japonicus TaxID=27405 RepID=UPI001C70D1FD|nr:putative protein TPRXL [Penaeus japonicus]